MDIKEYNTDQAQGSVDLFRILKKAFPNKSPIVSLTRSKRKYDVDIKAYTLTIDNFELQGYDHRCFWDAWGNWKKKHADNLYKRGTSCQIINDRKHCKMRFELLWNAIWKVNRDYHLPDFVEYLVTLERKNPANKGILVNAHVAGPIENDMSIGYTITISNTNSSIQMVESYIDDYKWPIATPRMPTIGNYRDAGGAYCISFTLDWNKHTPPSHTHTGVMGGRQSGKTLAKRLNDIEARLDEIEESM